MTCHCGNGGCNWRVHASPLPDGVTYKIKTLRGPHTCVRDTFSDKATSTWLAKQLATEIRTNLEIKLLGLQETINTKFYI